jgi:uncharacterized Ntn-hydrolase superfamily protein
MTFSIVARAADGRSFGIAVASKFLAVGSVVPAAEAGAGAIATQAYANAAYRPQALTLLRTGVSATDTLAGLVAADPGGATRQAGVVGPDGPGATHTGTECPDWAGGRAGDGYAIQGNILAGEQVVAEMESAWLAAGSGSFAARLLAALAAGDAAGGDRRGRQSAALYVVSPGGGYGGRTAVEVDLRVDDHPDPVAELRRLLDLHVLYLGRPDPASLLTLAGALAGEVRERLAALGHTGPAGEAGLDAALADWAGIENYEERLVPGRIDPLVLAKLREAQPR